MAFIVEWDESIPAGTGYIRDGDDAIRDLKYAIRERLAVDHKFASAEGADTDIGYHKQVTLIEAADIGTGETGLPILGAQTDALDAPELLFLDELDNKVWLTMAGNSIATHTPTDGAPTEDAGIANKKYVDKHGVVQQVYTQTGAYGTGTTNIPVDDTIPQKTEGDEYMTLAITPKSATNKLRISVVFIASMSPNDWVGVALFQGDVDSAIAAGVGTPFSVNQPVPVCFTHSMVSGTTSEITFKVRAGGTSGSSLYFNGRVGARFWGGVLASSITITELKP